MHIVAGILVGHRAVELVVEHLVQEFGVPREHVQIHASDAATGTEARSTQDGDQDASLPDLSLPREAAVRYEEGMRHGGILVVAQVDNSLVERAIVAFREYGATSPEAFDPDAADSSGSEESVRTRAYFLWEQDGRPEGRDVEYWERARAVEREGHSSKSPQDFAGETGAAPLPQRAADRRS
jgi:hypothetical protein